MVERKHTRGTTFDANEGVTEAVLSSAFSSPQPLTAIYSGGSPPVADRQVITSSLIGRTHSLRRRRVRT
jgi:hypothetical protein